MKLQMCTIEMLPDEITNIQEKILLFEVYEHEMKRCVSVHYMKY